ncbi:MAG: T9SS type A sorting domain-containing protein [Candidatus Cloacimonetes bacterium]|nr:T9SS type A sorting domain-containing protein [Candidatus Cloacimonadota bacterium]
MKKIFITFAILLIFSSLQSGTLFVGLESSSPPTYSSDLTGFPSVSWTQHYNFDVSGAAATPDGTLYLCHGAFNTDLFEAGLNTNPTQLCTIEEDMSALAYGRNKLWGYSNYADPKGIYSITPTTGEVRLELDVYTGTGYRFFALAYNPADDLFYGYTEYGDSGLYSINMDTGVMTKLVDTIPASNGQGRGMAIGNNTVCLTATRGDDGIPYYAYDLSQGIGGSWEEFTNPYPDYHSTGGAAWIPSPSEVEIFNQQNSLYQIVPNPFYDKTNISFKLKKSGRINLNVYNLKGQLVKSMINKNFEEGSHSTEWDGTNSNGKKIPAGIYFFQLNLNDERTIIKKAILLK